MGRNHTFIVTKISSFLTMITKIIVANTSIHLLVSSRKPECLITFYRKFNIEIRFMYY